MKQVLIKKGSVIVEEVPAPALDDNSVLVAVTCSLISAGTEVSTVAASRKSLARQALEQPQRAWKAIELARQQGVGRALATIRGLTGSAVASGYSCSGVVLQAGAHVTDLRPGMRVACAGAGKANHAEIVAVPRNLVVEIPEGCDLQDAASVTLGAIAMQGVRRADPRLGELVVVIGLGLIGQITVQLLKTAGCRVVGLDVDPRRVELARTFGIEMGVNGAEDDPAGRVRHLSGGHGADSVIITAASSSNAIVQQAMELCRRKGRVVVVGAVGMDLKRSPFYEKEIDFLISTSYGPGRYDAVYEREGHDYPFAYVRWTENRNMQAYLGLVAEGRVNVKALIERRYDVTEAARAFHELQTAPSKPLGVLLEYGAADGAALRRDTKVSLRPALKTDRVRVAVVGAGSFAQQMHLPNLQRLSDLFELRAVVSASGHGAKAAAERFGAAYASTRYDDVLADPDVDMVLICTRHHLHAAQAMAAARAGKAVLLEKPMALNRAELAALVAVLQETGTPFSVGYNRRFSPYLVEARRHTDARLNPLFMRYRMNAGYVPLDHWVHGPEGGGRIVGEACHVVDLFTAFTGSAVQSVSTRRLRPKTASLSPGDNVSIALTYADGSVGVLDYFALGARQLPKEQLEVHFDQKSIVVDDYKSIRGYGVRVKRLASMASEKGHLEELKAFHRALKDGTAPIPLWDLAQTTDVTLRADEDERSA